MLPPPREKLEAPALGGERDVHVRGEVAEDGTFSIDGLPAGLARVSVHGGLTHEGEHLHFSGEAEVESDEPVVIRVEIR